MVLPQDPSTYLGVFRQARGGEILGMTRFETWMDDWPLAGVALWWLGLPLPPDARPAPSIKKVTLSLWDSLMFGRVLGTRPNISEPHSEIGTRVPFCIAARVPED